MLGSYGKFMQFRVLSSRTLIGVTLVGLIFFLTLVFYFNFKNPIQEIAPETLPPNTDILEQEEMVIGLPVRLKIPTINVDASVESLGLTVSGDMDTPKGPDNVAWFELGTRPGENGSAVIAGHFGTWKNGKRSVFDNLHKLKAGDKVYIEDEKGESITFVVREIRNFDPQADATEVFSSDDDMAHLNLITCEGAWNKDSKNYSKRLVVFADKE